jgi:hypothetical protein
MTASAEDQKSFAFTEYHEAANAYFKGVDIGYTAVKSYITINGLFAALIGALADPKPGIMSSLGEMVKLVPWFAVVASLALVACVGHYNRHLENCRNRCEEIEIEYGGRFFKNLGVTSTGSWFTSTGGLRVLIYSIVSFWLYFAIKMQVPDFQLWKLIMNSPVGTTVMRFF